MIFSYHFKSQSVSDFDHYPSFGLYSSCFPPIPSAILRSLQSRQQAFNRFLALFLPFYKVDHIDEQGSIVTWMPSLVQIIFGSLPTIMLKE